MSAWNDPPKLKLGVSSSLMNSIVDKAIAINPSINNDNKLKPPLLLFEAKIENSTELDHEQELLNLLKVSSFEECKTVTTEKLSDIIKRSLNLECFPQLEKRLNQSLNLLTTDKLPKDVAISFMEMIFYIHCQDYAKSEDLSKNLAVNYTFEVSSWIIAYRKLLNELNSI